MKIAVSACLAGFACRYDGKANTDEFVRNLYLKGLAVPVCPECLGGLGIPRVPCEIKGNAVISAEGKDCTEHYCRGAFYALQYARLWGARIAVVKAKSPSCGLGRIYDGSFTRTLTDGDGVFVRLLKEQNFFVCTEKDDLYRKFLTYYGCYGYTI